MSLKISCKSEAKEENRRLILQFARRVFSNGKLKKNLRWLGLPSHEGDEITQITDLLGIPRRNVFAATNDEQEIEVIKKRFRDVKPLLLDVWNFENFKESFCRAIHEADRIDVPKAYLKKDRPNKDTKGHSYWFDVMHFDLYSYLTIPRIINMAMLGYGLLKHGGIFGITFLCGREQDDNAFKKTYQMVGEIMTNAQPFEKRINAAIFLLAQVFAFAYFCEQIAGIKFKERKNNGIWLLSNSEIDLLDKPQNQLLIKNSGFYPKDILKTYYINPKGTPMATVLIRFLRMGGVGVDSVLGHFDRNVNRCMMEPIQRIVVPTKTREKKQIKKKKDIKKRKIYNKIDNGNQLKNEVIELLKDPAIPREEILLAYPKMTSRRLAAYKAHITMGTYK